MRKLLFLCFLFLSSQAFSQEFNCTVQIISPQLQATDKKVLETLQNAIKDFVNNRKWTDDVFQQQEKIECTIIINISERNNDEFKGTIQVQSRRPVFKTSYYTTLINFLDDNLKFKYIEDQTLEFNENNNTSALTSIIAYYTYIFLGLDYDSFSLEGGNPYLQKAQNIVNMSQNNSEAGWKAFEGNRNRYWLTENLLVPLFKPVRETYYRYHRKGMDIMTADIVSARTEILQCLELMKKVAVERPNSLLIQMFFNAKSDELINIFSQASTEEKSRVITLLGDIDPSNLTKYQKIGK